MEEHSQNSSFREKLIEHLFIGELLKLAWHRKEAMEVSKPEVDNSGYDLIIEGDGVIRHIQLKASYSEAKTARQSIQVSLMDKPSACVVWIYFNEETLELGPFLFFGGEAGAPIPGLSDFAVAKHSKGNAEGVKLDRANLRVVPRGKFVEIKSISELYEKMFSRSTQNNPVTLQQLGARLAEMYNGAERGDQVSMIHLFGVRYAEQIQEAGITAKSIVIEAGLSEPYATEISKGIKLSKHVREL